MSYAEKRDGKPTGWFYGEVFVKDKRFRRRFETKKHADGYEVYLKLMGEEPPTLDNEGAGAGRSFAAVAAECKKAGGPNGVWLAGRDPSIIQRVEYCVKIIGHVDIANVTRKSFELITSSLKKRPALGKKHKLTNATINRYLNAASAIMTYAEQCEYIEAAPKAPLEREIGKKRGILHSFEQEDAILRVLEAEGWRVEALCVRVLVETGLRESELLERLRPEQITIETDADGNENGWINFAEDQTKNDEARTVYIRPDLAREVRALLASGSVPIASTLLKRFKRAVKACGYADNIVIHSLRHTRNTRLRKNGVDMKVRMKMLGHKSVAASMRYDHVDTDDQLQAAKKVENVRGDLRKSGTIVPFSNVKSA